MDGTKLKKLGWVQKTSFEEGLKITVEWYRRFGSTWWGDIEDVLSPFPIVQGKKVYKGGEGREEGIDDADMPSMGARVKRLRASS